MSLPIGSLLRKLAGDRRRTGRGRVARRGERGYRREEAMLLATEPLEGRSMLAVSIAAFTPGGPIQVVSDNASSDSVSVRLYNNTVAVPGTPPTPIVVPGISLYDQSNNVLFFGGQSFFPIVSPVTSAVYASGVQITGASTNSTAVTINDEISSVTGLVGLGSWNTLFSAAGASGTIQVVNPQSLTVATGAKVSIDGAFSATAPKLPSVKLEAIDIVVGKTAAVSSETVSLSTATGAGAITLLGSVTASNKLTINTKSVLDISQNISAAVLDLIVQGGATQSAGSLTGSTSFSLAASGGGVTLNKAGNNLASISSITAPGQDVVINTIGSVTQDAVKAILARSLSLTAVGGVTLGNAANDLDSVAIKAGGNVTYSDVDEVQIGTAGAAFGLTANSGSGNVTVTTANDLTQTAAGAVQAATLNVNLATGAGGGRVIKLDSPNNQVATFMAQTSSFGGGGITFVNATNKALIVGDGVNTISSGSDISITTQGVGAGTLSLRSPLSTPASITLSSGGAISQNLAAGLTATVLTVTNNAATGAITLQPTGGNDVAIVSIKNNSIGASKGISFTGSNAASGNLAIGGTGISAAAGTVTIDSNGRPLAINAGISSVGGDIVLTAANGISQGGGGIAGNLLKVTNVTSGSVVLNSATNDVASVAISNTAATGTVQYTDANDLTLGASGGVLGIKAGDSITLNVGKNFLAPAGTGLTTGAAGSLTVAAGGTVQLDSISTAGAGATFSGSGITTTAAVVGGTTGSVKFTAATTGVTIKAPVTAAQDVVLIGPTSVNLSTGAAVTATAGQIAVTSTAGGFVSAAGIAMTAGTDVTATTAATANFGGPVTAGTDVIVQASAGTADVILGGAVNAVGGQVNLKAGNAVTTSGAVVAKSFASTSTGGATSVGAITTTTTLSVVAGGSFANGGALTAGGALGVASVGSANIKAAVQGGSVSIASSAGSLAVATGATVNSSGDISLAGVSGVSLASAITTTGGNVTVKSSAGDLNFGAGAGISASTKTTTLTAATGIVQDPVASIGIQCNDLVVTNGASGAIALDNPLNNAVTFRATNAAASAALKYVDKTGVTLSLPGTSTNNGSIDITAGGAITLAGTLSSGTADTDLTAAGAVTQLTTGLITATKLGVDTSSVANGTVTLNKTNNVVGIIYGATKNGDFSFTAKDALQVGVANQVNLVTTANGGAGANIYVASGQGGTGALSLAADSISAGTGQIALQAKGGIADLTNVTISTSNALILANTVSGGITLASPTSTFPRLAATSTAASTINILDNTGVVIDQVTVAATGLTVTGLQTAGGTIVLNCKGPISQTAAGKVAASSASFTSTGTVGLAAAPNNNVATLAIQGVGNVDYTDADDFTVGVGGAGVVGKLGNIGLTSLRGSVTLGAEVSTTTNLEDATKTTITAAGAITQTAGRVLSSDLVMTANGGDINVSQATNDIANLRAKAPAGNVTYLDFSDFEVGLDSVVPPYATKAVGVLAAGNITLTAAPTFVVPVIPASAGPIGLGFLRVTEGLSWLGALSLKAGLGSRSGYVDFAITSSGDSGLFNGCMRNMINYSNANVATQTINGATRAQPMRLVFDETGYPVTVVTPTSALPTIVKPLDINGTLVEATVANPRVGINGGSIPTTSVVNGLVYGLGSSDSRISGLAVYGYATGSGIQFASAVNTIINTYAGLQRDGTTKSPNKIGIELTGLTATTNTIGTVTVNELAANVIGGNSYAGIVARNGSTGNAIVGNYIGTDSAGNALGNSGFGISLEAVNGNVIGTRNAVRPDGTAAASNVIANNGNSGVRILNARAANASLGNAIENNLIDSNGIDGVQIVGSTFQTIGGQQPRQANVITGQAGAPASGGNGISVTTSADISIFANFIGVDEVGSGLATLGNFRAGVLVDGSTRTVIAAGNRIGLNRTGVTVRNGATATRIEGNYIGTNEADATLGNTGDGVAIDRSIGNFVRLGNVIANSGGNGVNITDSTAATLAAGNVVSGNFVRRNGAAGVKVAGGARTTVGGTGVGNVIVANAAEGILVDSTTFTGSAIGVAIQGNYVGTSSLEEVDPTLGNNVGIRLKKATSAVLDGRNVIANSAGDGVRVEGSSKTTVGSAASGGGNVITANNGTGVVVTDKVTGVSAGQPNSGNNLFGNTISGNSGGGVLVRGVTLTNGSSTTSGVVIGTSAIPGLAITGRGNTITGNTGVGVTIDGAQSVLVEGNSIYGNTGVPISILNGGNAGAVAPTLASATVVQRSGAVPQVVVQGMFATAGTGTVNVVAGRATFSTPQAGATVGAVIVINGTGYRVTSVISSVAAGSTVVQLDGTPSTVVTGTGRVASTAGAATFSVPQAASLVGQSIIVAGRSYAVSSLSADGRTARLAGNPTFLVSAFSTVQSVSFGILPTSVLNQQYVIDLYLNDPGDGTPGAGGSGTGYGMRTFLGRVTVTVGPTGPGTFTATVNLPAGVIPAGQFVTATASTVRSGVGTSPFSTSQVSSVARQLAFASPAGR